MGSHVPNLEEARRLQHEADARTREGIAGYLLVSSAAHDGAGSATAGACAAHDLADGLGGPGRASSAAVAAQRLCDSLRELGRALDQIGEGFARFSDLARDVHIADLRDRFGNIPDDYLRDLLGPDYHPPGANSVHGDHEGSR